MSTPRTVVLIACSSRKLNRKARAKDLYQGTLFRASLAWARSQAPDTILVLSAKYGLVGLDEVIEPYDLTLNELPVAEVRGWSERVLRQLSSRFNPEQDRFIFLAGERYRRFLEPRLANVETPLAALRFGEQVSWLQNNLKSRGDSRKGGDSSRVCKLVHDWANALPRHRLPIRSARIPKNGLYIVFERGECAHGGDRIVRIGTHTGDGNLPARLRQHFVTESKDRSIFRKNIGRTLLARDSNQELLEQWNLDLTSRAAKERHGNEVNHEALREVESRVSNYIRGQFSFTVVEEPDRERRLTLEKGLIAAVAQCARCQASDGWTGHHSPIETIRESGLWLTQHVGALPLSESSVKALKGRKYEMHSDERKIGKPELRARKGRSGGKYWPLGEYLTTASDVVDLSFGEIEHVLGARLPASARQYRPWWANHEGDNKSPQSRAWQDAGFRVDSVRLGKQGSVRFTRVGSPGLEDRESEKPGAVDSGEARTHGGRSRSFSWRIEGDSLRILSESGVSHEYSVQEVLAILNLLHAHFRNNWFPLANNVEKLHHGTERYGLGAGAIHQQRPGDTLHAQGASYLGVVLEQAAIFEWNGNARQIQWRICRMPDDLQELRFLITGACAGK